MTDFKDELFEGNDLFKGIDKVDILVGIPSYNNAHSIEKVVMTSAEGLEMYYPQQKSIIINSDGQSQDNTVSIFKKTRVPKGIGKRSFQYSGDFGKGSALRAIFEAARILDAKVCVVLDADTRSITSDWIYSLVSPVFKLGYGFVSPYYVRNKHDATVTNEIVYPLTRALYGLRIRQPIGGDFAFSNGAVQVFTRNKYWESYPYINQFGVDIWMSTTAINEGFRVCQTVLGVKVHDKKDIIKDMAKVFVQVTGTLFELMKNYEQKWFDIIGSNQGYIHGDFKFVEGEKISLNINELLQKFYDGYEKYKNVWKKIFEKNTYLEFLDTLNASSRDNIVLSAELWTKIVYEYACIYGFIKKDQKEKLLESMVPFYFLRTASFIKEAELFSDEIADAVVEGDAGLFERLKWYLINRWQDYKSRNKEIIIF